MLIRVGEDIITLKVIALPTSSTMRFLTPLPPCILPNVERPVTDTDGNCYYVTPFVLRRYVRSKRFEKRRRVKP